MERTGSATWKRTDLQGPWAAALAKSEDSVLVTVRDEKRVVQLALGSGATIKVFGSETLKDPRGIAVGPAGDVFVADCITKLVHVFDGCTLGPLRSLGAGVLKTIFGVCVDSRSQVYVCDADDSVKALVVLDGITGKRVASAAIPGQPRGVTVTRRGTIVVTHVKPTGLVEIDS